MKNKSYDIELIRKYATGKLDTRAAYELERKAESDPLLADLIAGMEAASGNLEPEHLQEIEELISQRINKKRSFRTDSLIRLSVAAALLFAVLTAEFFMLEDKSPVRMAKTVDRGRGRVIEASTSKPTTLPEREVQLAQKPESKKKVLKPVSETPRKPQEVTRNTHTAIPNANRIAGVAADNYVVRGYQKQNREATSGNSFTPSAKEVQDVRIASSFRVISGTVTDEYSKETLPGVTVYLKGEKAAVTDASGKFSILAQPGETLEVSFIGYNKRRIAIKSQDSLQVSLEPAMTAMSDVVVRGYQKRNREVTTGSSFIVSGKEVQDVPIAGSRIISGAVVDENNEPLPGVAVYVKGEKGAAVTDVTGKFSIEVSRKGQTLEVSTIGYNKELVNIDNQDSLTIKLEHALTALNEVSVIKPTPEAVGPTQAKPSTGWPAYRKYLQENGKSADATKGTVTLSFRVSSDGNVVDLKILKGLSEANNLKAANLITSGPNWKGNPRGLSGEVILKIKFH